MKTLLATMILVGSVLVLTPTMASAEACNVNNRNTDCTGNDCGNKNVECGKKGKDADGIMKCC